MFPRDIGMERGVDGGRAWIQFERAMWEIADHLVLKLNAAVKTLQGNQLFHVERREPVHFDRPNIAARAFDPKDFDILACQWIALHCLG